MRAISVEGPETAYLFQCRSDAALFAVSWDEKAANIPPSPVWYGGWRLRRAVALASMGSAPMGEDAKLIADGVRSVGYYIWRDSSAWPSDW
jgi:hypothetical protein